MASSSRTDASPTSSLNNDSNDSSSTPTPNPASSNSTINNNSQQRTQANLPGRRSPLSFASSETSRETSPSRQWLPSNTIHQIKDNFSRPGHLTAIPTRSISVPNDATPGQSAASVSKNTASANPLIHKPAALNDAVNKLWKLQRQQNTSSSEGALATSPMSSPQLRSPPLSLSSRRNSSSSIRHSETEAFESSRPERCGGLGHSIVPERDVTLKHNHKSQPTSQAQSNTGVKLPRGFSSLSSTLETVEEGDNPTTPSNGLTSSASSIAPSIKTIDLAQEQMTSDCGKDDRSSLDGGDGNSLSRVPTVTPSNYVDDKDRKSEARRESSTRSAFPVARRPFTSLVPSKVRTSNDGPSRLMTVETETVSSIPQTCVGGGNGGERSGAGRREESGTLRTKGSNETIKPKKEKKKNSKKTSSIISGTTSSKADIFEAKVASAVDEDSSDSDETFVYESNPPEPRARQHRHHSRTPSVSSMQSLGDRRGTRVLGTMLDGPRRLRGKRSMKFASNQYSVSNMDDESGDGGQTTPRASNQRINTSGEMQNKHLGIYNRQPTDYLLHAEREPLSYPSKSRNLHGYDFRSSPKTQSPAPNSRTHSRPQSRKGELPYDFDGERADDERAPLIGSVRSQRTRLLRRQRGSMPQHDDFYDESQRGWFGRFAGCFLMFMTIVLLIMGAAAFFFATTKPLYEVNIREIQNVLASEQAIMLDLLVEAINPNVVSLTITDMDVNLFAKSRHANTEFSPPQNHSGDLALHGKGTAWRRRRGNTSIDTIGIDNVHRSQGVDKGTDTEEDPAGDPQTMLLGRICHFDSALVFDGSPLRRLSQNSSGELRLARPGNKTDDDGTERWERVVQHPFELVVRGILKYQLPLSSRTMTASVGGSVVVHPEAGIDGEGSMKTDKVRRACWEA